ncbi:unnamed protein product [Phytophthora fragariaefolia]|uniref:Unnamed protein product n=1 Tax=Phytophthora fragariaefolia TaxID=1490495 RepID=A0A9W6TPF9_9STRA|nr:unnamed protein product [Phytophthora fragariaefolia]
MLSTPSPGSSSLSSSSALSTSGGANVFSIRQPSIVVDSNLWKLTNACQPRGPSLPSALGAQINAKQVRDHLTLLKGLFKNAEAVAARGSGIEKSVGAVNVQSHYDEHEGLVREYVALEDHFKAEKMAVKTRKQQKDEDLP